MSKVCKYRQNYCHIYKLEIMRLQVILKHRSYILKDFTLNVSFHIEKGNNL